MKKKKRIWTRLASLCLTLLMSVVMFGTVAFADINEDEGVINVSGVENAVTVSAYKVLDVNFDYTTQATKDPMYTWNSAVQPWVKDNYASYIASDNSVTEAFSSANASDIATFYDKMSAAIRSNQITISTAQTRTGNGTLEGLSMGGYLILIENGMDVYRPSAVNVVPSYNEGTKEWELETATVQVKSSGIDIDKTVNEDVKTDGHNPSVSDNGAIGDTVNYDLRSDIPQFPANALNKGYYISDTLSAGLTLVDDSIKVYGVKGTTETLLAEDDAYTRGTVRPDANKTVCTFVLNFDYDKISGYDSIHVDYDATINKNAVIGPAGNENKAILDYNNNPYDDDWSETDPTVKVYSYGIKINKVNKDDELLTGAEFNLSERSDGTNAMSFVKTGDGTYRLAETGENGTTTTLAVGSNGQQKGKITLSGLGVGTYYLKETKAPDGGYNMLNRAVKIEIKDTDFDGQPTIGEGTLEYSDGYVPVDVVNTQGFQLPETGGMGTILFTAGGIAVMGAAVLLVIMLLRRKAVK